ncbi:GFA family protein [Chitinibacter sp. S2-10]|uniref:GFA family protein n=1 Tax=Chitinibacter sp. S2-10 TaxID=3373597 RepID=UPI003977ACF2
MSVQGSCACGAVVYEVGEFATPVIHCNCKTCRRSLGVAFNSVAGAKCEQFRIVQGQTQLKFFASSPGKQRFFCTECGTHLYAQKAESDMLIVRVGTLHDDPGIRPAMHIWTSHREPWLAYEGLAEHAEWQPGRG